MCIRDRYYSFDHKGVHFVVLNSILTTDEWTFHRWPSDEQRMQEMAGLDNPNGSPFMVGEKQRAWLKEDLSKIQHDTPIVVFSHSPLQKIYKGWNFWTDDAEEVQALLLSLIHIWPMTHPSRTACRQSSGLSASAGTRR